MHITITFDGVFDGKVYAKGYYDIPHCSAYGTGADYVTLVLPLDGCGMEEITHDFGASSRGDDYHGYGVSYSTTIIVMFQTYTGVLEEWDKVFSVKCDNDKLPEKVLKFGLEVPDVHATVVPTYKAKIPDVYLSVVGGKDMYGPPTTSLYVGERAALLIIAHDTSYYDIKVVNCYAHDGKNRHKILLIDNNGCPAAQKIIGAVQKDTDQPGYGKSAYYAYFKAFKFPDNNNVYFQCSVRICHQQCDVHSCRDKYGGSGYGSDRRNDGYGNDVYGGGGGGGYGEDDRYGYGSDSGGYADILYRRKRNVEDLHHGLPEFWNGTVLFGNHSDDSAANLTGIVEDEREVSRGITIVMPGEEEAEITELKAHNRWPAEVTGVCVDRVALYGAAAGAGSVIVILIVATVIFYSRLNTLRNMQHRKQAEDRILEKKHRRMQR
ncbi:PREDICTED: cuticlin-1-like [Priapulus caudatus]|uniref:Cuticlin-1-like n=1 Tax=Priapulus caudatus TaxID=37621 RepID=A0ABM1EJS1_PRICU|nr:PREDICTED: cuticlin-1-like [Priapulus caudatus]